MNPQPKSQAKKRASPIMVVGVILAGYVILGIFAKYVQERSAPPNPSTSLNSQPPLSVSDLKLEYDNEYEWHGIWYYTGTVTNNSNKQFSYVQVEINLYDDTGALVDNVIANAANLEPHGTWKFRALVLNHNWSTSKLKSVTGY